MTYTDQFTFRVGTGDQLLYILPIFMMYFIFMVYITEKDKADIFTMKLHFSLKWNIKYDISVYHCQLRMFVMFQPDTTAL